MCAIGEEVRASHKPLRRMAATCMSMGCSISPLHELGSSMASEMKGMKV